MIVIYNFWVYPQKKIIMIIDRINNWFNLSKQYFFTYSNEFFNLSYLSNSPEVIVKSCSKMPFMKHDKKRQMLHADTPFVKGEFYYVELEDGLWIMLSDMSYKNNVSYQPVYDKFLPADYYFISINNIESNPNNDSYKFDNYKIENNSLSFGKPASDFLNGHFKGSREKMYILYFNHSWALKHILNSENTSKVVKELFHDKEKTFLNYSYKTKDFDCLIENLSENFRGSSKPNLFDLKKLAYNYFSLFFDSLEQEENLNSNELSHGDRIVIQKIEHYLMNNLYAKFPGIDVLSAKYKISPTKLKQNFKLLFGNSVFKYFQNHKMQMAKAYVLNKDLRIKDISSKFGYENVSKFSKSFESCHNKLPSEFRK